MVARGDSGSTFFSRGIAIALLATSNEVFSTLKLIRTVASVALSIHHHFGRSKAESADGECGSFESASQ
jgi:hypothetical protein